MRHLRPACVQCLKDFLCIFVWRKVYHYQLKQFSDTSLNGVGTTGMLCRTFGIERCAGLFREKAMGVDKSSAMILK